MLLFSLQQGKSELRKPDGKNEIKNKKGPVRKKRDK